MNPEKPKGRIVEIGAVNHPQPRPENKDERLEEMLKIANLLGPENNQSGGGKKNPDKSVRAARRAKKLARKKQRYK